LPSQLIDSPDQKKNGKGHNEKTNHGIDEKTIVDGHCACCLGCGKGFVRPSRLCPLLENKEEI
jgi:hypothetical protein